MTNWQEIYRGLKEEKTFYHIAVQSQQNAENYFNWLESKYPATKTLIQDSRRKHKGDLDDYFTDEESLESIVTLLNTIIDSDEVKKSLAEEAEGRLKELLVNNKSSDPLIANFQSNINNDTIEHLKKEILEGVQFNSQSIVFFTNVLVEELYLNTLPKYFNELLNATPQKSLSNLLSKPEWEEGKKKLFDALHNNFSGCENSEELKELDDELEKTVKELETIINSAKPEQETVVPVLPPIPPIVTPGNNDSAEIKEIQDLINSFRGKNHTDRKDSDRSDLIKDLKQKIIWISTGTNAQKEAAGKKFVELEETIEDLGLEIFQYEAIQEIRDELDDKRNNGQVKLKKDDLTEQDYTNFDSKIFQLKNKIEVNAFKKRVIENIIDLRGPYSFLDKIIAKGEEALNNKDNKAIQDVLGSLNTYYETTNDVGKKAYEQRKAIINNLENRLMQQAQQLHVTN